MAEYLSGSFLSPFSTTSMTGLKRMRRQPIARRTVVSQPYLPARPSITGWTAAVIDGVDGGELMVDGSDSEGRASGAEVVGWAWRDGVINVRSARVRRVAATDRGIVMR